MAITEDQRIDIARETLNELATVLHLADPEPGTDPLAGSLLDAITLRRSQIENYAEARAILAAEVETAAAKAAQASLTGTGDLLDAVMPELPTSPFDDWEAQRAADRAAAEADLVAAQTADRDDA